MNTEIPESGDHSGLAGPVTAERPPSIRERIADRQRPLRGQVARLARRMNWQAASLLVVAALAIPVWRGVTSHANPHLPPVLVATPAPPAQTVAVARVTREDLYSEVPFLAEFRPYLQVELHAKVSGYVEKINVDIGDQVKSGQLLAKLEVPELKDELDRAQAAEKRAKADYKEAHLVYQRLEAVDKDHPNLVAQQELDAAEAKDSTTEAAIAEARAAVEKYQTLLKYTLITAPFDGVITHRYADPGSLIQAGTASDTQSMPLVRLSDNYHLRLDFPVDVKYVKDVHVGDTVTVRVESLGDESFKGTITRTALQVNEDTRTMTTEVEVPNPTLELVPGMYANVMFKVQSRTHALAIPIEAVPPGQTNTVYVVNGQNRIEERAVRLGTDTATKYEVKAGLKEGELVLTSSRSQVCPGQQVEAKVIGSLAQE